jgi:hypothetical protein
MSKIRAHVSDAVVGTKAIALLFVHVAVVVTQIGGDADLSHLFILRLGADRWQLSVTTSLMVIIFRPFVIISEK